MRLLGWMVFWFVLLFNLSNVLIYMHSPLKADARTALLYLIVGCLVVNCLLGGVLIATRPPQSK